MDWTGIDSIDNRDKIAVVVVGYNRLDSIKRLLGSLTLAEYPVEDVPLIISIDASGDPELYEYIRQFKWTFGDKYVNIETKRLGLRKHILQCGDLTRFFKAIVLLEDDIFVSPYFYSYVQQTLDKYGDDDRVGQISLYKDESCGFAGLPFQNIQDGSDVFLIQSVNSWGECWTEGMWNAFRQWYNVHADDSLVNVDMPGCIMKWTRSWSKYYHAYLIETGRYVLYPNVSMTTNFSDAGEHGGNNNSLVQSNLAQGTWIYRLPDFEKLTRYDIYCNNLDSCKWLGISEDDLTLDYYGINDNKKGRRYILSSRILPFAVIKTFGLMMRPIELNVKYAIKGSGLYLYDAEAPRTESAGCGRENMLVSYFLRDFTRRRLIKYSMRYVADRILFRLRWKKS